jgi:hypothetical protein
MRPQVDDVLNFEMTAEGQVIYVQGPLDMTGDEKDMGVTVFLEQVNGDVTGAGVSRIRGAALDTKLTRAEDALSELCDERRLGLDDPPGVKELAHRGPRWTVKVTPDDGGKFEAGDQVVVANVWLWCDRKDDKGMFTYTWTEIVDLQVGPDPDGGMPMRAAAAA